MSTAQGRTADGGDNTHDLARASAARDRLTLLRAVLDDAGVIGEVRPVGGYPVLFLTDPRAPWGVSVGEVGFWLGDPPEMLCRNDRVLEAAWLIAARLRRRSAAMRRVGRHAAAPRTAVAPA